MRHTDFKDKNSSFNIIETCSDDTKVFKFTLSDGLSELDTIEATEIGDFYSFSIDTPDEDCFLFTKQGLNIGIFRVGKPDVLVIVCSDEDETISYKQLDMDGAKLDEGDMEEIGEGFYYIEPSTLDKSFFTIEDMIIPLVVPYRLDYLTSKGTIRLESDRFELISMPVRGETVASYFIPLIEDATGKDASESIELVKAYPSNDVSSGKWLVYIPGLTKDTNTNNFKLVEEDDGVETHVPFLVRTKVLDEPIILEWDAMDGEE